MVKRNAKEHNHPLRSVEKVVDKAVPFLLIALAIAIILDNPFWTLFDLHHYETEVFIFDTIVLVFLVFDLIFKWMHIKNLKLFFKFHWLEILAVFPFYLVFRVYLITLEIARTGEEAQRILHQALLARETSVISEAKFFRAAEASFRESRPFVRLLRTFSRTLRFVSIRFKGAINNLLYSSFRNS